MKIWVDINFVLDRRQSLAIKLLVVAIKGKLHGTLREIGSKVGIKNSPQQTKHYLLSLMAEGLIYRSGAKSYDVTPEFRKSIKIERRHPNKGE